MAKLRRGQKIGSPDLWTQSGGEGRVVEEFSQFDNLKKKIPWNSPLWATLADRIFRENTISKRKWLSTIWHSDRKCIRTRVILIQKIRKMRAAQGVDSGQKHTEASELRESIVKGKTDKTKEDEGKTATWLEDVVKFSARGENGVEIDEVIAETRNSEDSKDEAALQSFEEVAESRDRQDGKDEDGDSDGAEDIAVSSEAEEKMRSINDDGRKADSEEMYMPENTAGTLDETNSTEYADDAVFCICKQPNNPDEPYAQCCHCKDWFHPACIGYKSIEDIAAISPWHCPSCHGELKATHADEDIGQLIFFCPKHFSVKLTHEEWLTIKPNVGQKVLKKGWTDLISRKISTVNKYCVLVFKRNKVQRLNSRMANIPYWTGTAVCKFKGCTTYSLVINQDQDKSNGEITIDVTLQGAVAHIPSEQHSRHCRQPERQSLKGKLGEFTPMHVHTKQIVAADEDQLFAGNLNCVKSLGVLQKISSEKNLDNRLDRDVFMECLEIQHRQDMENPSAKIKHAIIQYLAMSPFVIHWYSESQLHVLRELERKGNCFLYLDATGSVVAKPPSCSQSVLYYALCIPCQATTKTVVPMAEMLTSDQSTATILHWLTCLRRDYHKMFHKNLKPQKVETDFSWAMIHAVVQAFNSFSFQDYLKHCFQVCQGQQTAHLTLIHICAAHMLKLVSMKLSKKQCKKQTKQLFLFSFALVQNARTFAEAMSIMRSMVFVFSSCSNNKFCQEHFSALQDAIKTQKTDKIKVKNPDAETKEEDDTTLTTTSPFIACIEGMIKQAQEEADKEEQREEGVPNPYHCRSVVDILLHYAGTLPLWTGIMLHELGKTRDSNAVVENWFRTTKNVVLKNKLHRRPGDFLQVQTEFVVGRLRGIALMKYKLPKTQVDTQSRKKTEEPETQPLSQEEKWRKRSTGTRKRKSKYFCSPPPAKRTFSVEKQGRVQVHTIISKRPNVAQGRRKCRELKVPSLSQEQAQWKQGIEVRESSPSSPEKKKGCCPQWGGKGMIRQQMVSLRNTCTVDNLLYTIHLAIKRKPGIKNDLTSIAAFDPWITTLLQVHELFEKAEWTQGKLLWLNSIGRFKGQTWNAFGAEEDMVVCRLDYLLATEIEHTCSNMACPISKRTYQSVEIVCTDFANLQNDIDSWANHSLTTAVCKKASGASAKKGTSQRVFIHGLPCLLLVLILHKEPLSQRQHPTALPHHVTILGGKYEPAAITYHLGNSNHFVAFHKLANDNKWHFYDGLEERHSPGGGDIEVTEKRTSAILRTNCRVGHIVMVRDRAAETREAML